MITMTKNYEEATCVTHAGNFHADDCFGAAFLDKLYDNITLIRLKEYQDTNEKLTFDIGLGEFDHHGVNPKKREDNITYCGFGLLWQKFGREYLKKINVSNIEDTFKVMDYLLVENIDAFDNGEMQLESNFNIYTIPSLIEMMRGEEIEKEDEYFLRATKFASFLFDLILKTAINRVQVIEDIKNKEIKDKVLILDKFIPYEFAVFYLNLDVEFAVYPSNRGGYAARTIPTKYKGFTSKIPFKKEWGGLRDQELANISGIKTANFCHNKYFLFVAGTKEDALKAIELTRKEK